MRKARLAGASTSDGSLPACAAPARRRAARSSAAATAVSMRIARSVSAVRWLCSAKPRSAASSPAERAIAPSVSRPVDQRQRRGDQRAGHGQPAEPGMEQEQHAEEQRHPGQVEQRAHRRAGEKAAHQCRDRAAAGSAGRSASGASQTPEGGRGRSAVEPQRGRATSSGRAGSRRSRGSRRAATTISEEADQRRHRARGQHPVVDLQHVERAGQHQHVEHGGEAEDAGERRRQPAQRWRGSGCRPARRGGMPPNWRRASRASYRMPYGQGKLVPAESSSTSLSLCRSWPGISGRAGMAPMAETLA